MDLKPDKLPVAKRAANRRGWVTPGSGLGKHLLWLCCLSLCWPEGAYVQARTYQSGLKLFSSRNYSGAARAFEQALARRPSRTTRFKILKMLGIAKARSGDRRGAVAAFKGALKIRPSMILTKREAPRASTQSLFRQAKSGSTAKSTRNRSSGRSRGRTSPRQAAAGPGGQRVTPTKPTLGRTFLEVKSNVPTATISIDGILAGRPGQQLNADPGTVEIEITAPGYKSRKARARLVKGRATTVELNLTKKPTRREIAQAKARKRAARKARLAARKRAARAERQKELRAQRAQRAQKAREQRAERRRRQSRSQVDLFGEERDRAPAVPERDLAAEFAQDTQVEKTQRRRRRQPMRAPQPQGFAQPGFQQQQPAFQPQPGFQGQQGFQQQPGFPQAPFGQQIPAGQMPLTQQQPFMQPRAPQAPSTVVVVPPQPQYAPPPYGAVPGYAPYVQPQPFGPAAQPFAPQPMQQPQQPPLPQNYLEQGFEDEFEDEDDLDELEPDLEPSVRSAPRRRAPRRRPRRKASSGSQGTNIALSFLPLGIGQFVQGDYLLGIAFGGGQVGGGLFWYLQTQEAAATILNTSATLVQRNQERATIQDPNTLANFDADTETFRQSRQVFVNDLETQALYGLIAAGVSYGLSVTFGIVKATSTKKRRPRRRLSLLPPPPGSMAYEQLDERLFAQTRASKGSFDPSAFNLDVSPLPSSDSPRPGWMVRVGWRF